MIKKRLYIKAYICKSNHGNFALIKGQDPNNSCNLFMYNGIILSKLMFTKEKIPVDVYCKTLNICEPLVFANFANGLNSQK